MAATSDAFIEPAGISSPAGLSRLAYLTVAATYLLIVVGAVVRVTGSGLGCPDWPLCHGQLVPPFERTALTEYAHRLLGAIVSVLILAVSGLGLLRGRRAVLLPAILVPPLLAVQIALGAIVVALELPGLVVLVHLGFAELILGMLAWVAVWSAPAARWSAAADERAGQTVPRGVARLVFATSALVLALIVSGAYVLASEASWACVGFPTCNGELFPLGTSFVVDVHLAHRLLALLVAGLIGLSLFQVYRRGGQVRGARPAAQAAAGLVLLQAAIGAYAVSFGITPLTQTLHVAGATAVWTSMAVLAAQLARAQRQAAQPSCPG